MKRVFTLMIFVLVAMTLATAQNAPIPTQPFSFNAQAIALPGGHGTFAGTDAGVSFSPTQNFSISEHNVLSSDGRVQFFAAGPDYQLPVLSLKANNAMPTLSGFRFLFSLGGALGIARATDASGIQQQHWGADAHGAFSYSLDAGATWQLGVRGGVMRLPYYNAGWTKYIEVGPSFHF